MASNGTYISACGYYYHGPKGEIGFSLKFRPEAFKAIFTSAEGRGIYQQQVNEIKNETSFLSRLTLLYGKLELSQLQIEIPRSLKAHRKIAVRLRDQEIAFTKEQNEEFLVIVFSKPVTLFQNDQIAVQIT